MEIIIRGDKMEITPAMKNHVEEKLQKLDKYLEKSEEVRANVLIKVKGHNQTVEVTIPLHNFIIRAEETKEDFYAAIDKAVDIIERQIKKNKTKIKAKATKTKYDFKIFDIMDEEEATEEKVIKRKKVEIKPMDEEEAILQLELLGHEFYLFKNIDTNKEAVIYKRKNGNYGLIEAE